jgi:hypothetical protein
VLEKVRAIGFPLVLAHQYGHTIGTGWDIVIALQMQRRYMLTLDRLSPSLSVTPVTILVRAIVRDAGGYVKSLELSFHVAADIDPPYAGDYGNSLEVLDEITYDSFGNVLNETNPAAGDRFRFTARE